MKVIPKGMTETQHEVLRQFIIGYTEEEIVQRMKMQARTIRDVRLSLYKMFGVRSLNNLCREAATVGFGNDFIQNLASWQQHTTFEKLGMREVLILQELFFGSSDQQIKNGLPQMMEEKTNTPIKINYRTYNELKDSIRRKLKINSMSNVFICAILSGYIVPTKITEEDVDMDKLNEDVKEFMLKGEILKVPVMAFKRNFELLCLEETSGRIQ